MKMAFFYYMPRCREQHGARIEKKKTKRDLLWNEGIFFSQSIAPRAVMPLHVCICIDRRPCEFINFRYKSIVSNDMCILSQTQISQVRDMKAWFARWPYKIRRLSVNDLTRHIGTWCFKICLPPLKWLFRYVESFLDAGNRVVVVMLNISKIYWYSRLISICRFLCQGELIHTIVTYHFYVNLVSIAMKSDV